MQEIPGVLWDKAGNAYAEAGSFEGEKQLMKFWLKSEPTGHEFSEKYNLEENVIKLAEVLSLHNMVVSIPNLIWVYERLRDSGGLATPQATVEVEVPRGKDGRPLTSSQLEWRNFAIWASDPKTSSRGIAERRRTSPSFNKFYLESLKREMAQPIDGEVTPSSGEMRPTSVRGRL